MEAEKSSIDGEGAKGGENGEPMKDAHVVEIVERTADSESVSRDEITPLLIQSEKPKINISSLSYPRRKREQMTRTPEMEISPFTQFMLWAWNGSRYSGLLCMALSSVIYCCMEVFSDVFSAQCIPIFEIAFTRCTVILVLSFLWLRRSGQPILGPANVRKLLVPRAIVGYFSLLCFIYCIQRLPLSQALILSFMTPVMASVTARFILHEKLNIAEIGGLACSFFGVIFIFRPMFPTQGVLDKARDASGPYIQNSNNIFAVLVGLVSSIAGGISYCLIRAGSKASDQPVLTVFSFGIFASPAAAICTFSFHEFVFPGIYSFLIMLILGVLAFFAEIFLARGLQLEKTSRVANIQYLEVYKHPTLCFGFDNAIGKDLLLQLSTDACMH